MADAPGILYATTINGDGTGTPLTDRETSEHIKAETLAWVHLDGRHPEARTWIQSELSYLDPLIVSLAGSMGRQDPAGRGDAGRGARAPTAGTRLPGWHCRGGRTRLSGFSPTGTGLA